MGLSKGLPGCPKCGGKGVILPDWNVSPVTIVCSCAGGSMQEEKFNVDIDDTFKHLSMEKFINYWHNVSLKDKNSMIKDILGELENIQNLIPTLNADNKIKCVNFLAQCQNKTGGWNIDYLIEPDGFKNALLWSQGRINDYDIIVILGDIGKGKTSLLASMLLDRCRKKEVNGKFVRCRALSSFLKSAMYSGARSFQRYTDTIEALIAVPVLALDDIDCIDKDEKIAKDFMMFLSERKSLHRPTILSSSKNLFIRLNTESPLANSNDPSMLEALKYANRINLETLFYNQIRCLDFSHDLNIKSPFAPAWVYGDST